MNRFFKYSAVFWLFCLFLVIGGVLFLALPKQTRSETEKRNLAKTEPFTWDLWWSKQYSTMLDNYIADHFPYRESWIQAANYLKQHKGIQDNEVAFVNPVMIPKKTTPIIENTVPPQNNRELADTSKKDSLRKKNTPKNEVNYPETNPNNTNTLAETEEAIYKNGILIYKNMALQFFGGSETMAKYFAKTMNEYHAALSPKKVTVHCIVPPSSGAYYIPDKIRKGTSEKQNLDIIRANLNSGVHMPKVYEILEEHKNEYIYFNTDHHWTGLAAYYAYQVFCEDAGIEPVPLENMQRKVIHKFLGSLYYLLQDNRLYKGMDSVIYYKVPTPCQMYVYTGENYAQKSKSPLYAEYARGGASYGVFLGADHRFLEINTELKNGKRAIVLKNSYGNPFIPYLVSHYEKIIAIDYRYYEGKGVKKLVDEHNITDVILVTTSVFANVSWHSDRLKIVLNK